MFLKETYVNRRAGLKSAMKNGILLFLGNEESPMNYRDNTFNFRQDSTFLYYFGLDQAGLAAVIDLDESREIIFGDELTIDDIVWMGFLPTIRERAQLVGIKETLPAAKLSQVLTEAKSKGRKIHFLPPYRPENILKLYHLLNIHPEKASVSASVDLINAVATQRNIKSEEEVAEIEKAVNITADMHLAAIEMTAPGKTEAEIAARVHQVALKGGGNIAFPIILTIHGETLHNHYHGNTLKEGDLVLNDSGAETSLHYAGDMSRTFPVSGRFTERQKEIYQVALNSHEHAISLLKPGVNFKDIHLAACRKTSEGLKELGFMKGDLDEAVAAGAHALFFQCGLGHLMGLDVHDMEDLGEVYVGYAGQPKSTQFGLKSLRLGRKLEPGYVLTIEPGIYFIPQLIDMWKKENKFSQFINYDKVETYRNFGGLRSEEDFVITRNGARLLGKPVPKTISDIENLMNR